MINSQLLYKRLSLIKQLINIGVEQSHQSESIAVFSLLAFHDSIEMFLKLLCEHKNLKSEKIDFMNYWELIPDLTLKESMRNLNARRVNLKHKGLLPAKSEIEISRVNTIDFFEQNTLLQFGVDYKDISLIGLVDYSSVKNYLEISQNSLNSGDIEKCIENAAFAFDELLYLYEGNKGHWKSPFHFGKDMRFQTSFFMGLSRSEFSEFEKLGKFVDVVTDSLTVIQKAIKINCLGIDYKEFIKFDFLTPNVIRWEKRELQAEMIGKKKWTIENCQYCIDFVIKAALKLQEFDFDISSLVEDNILEITDKR